MALNRKTVWSVSDVRDFILDGQWPLAQRTDEYVPSLGTTTWTVPSGVTTVHIVTVGGGGGGGFQPAGDAEGGGGGGGALSYVNNITVVPGEVLTMTVGAGGVGGNQTTNVGATGGKSSVSRGGTVLVSAAGGTGGNISMTFPNVGTPGTGGLVSDGVGTSRFAGGNGSGITPGGAGKYTANGTAGGGGTPLAGTTGPSTPVFGQGGAGQSSGTGPGNPGRDGGIRVIWGEGYSYPNNANIVT